MIQKTKSIAVAELKNKAMIARFEGYKIIQSIRVKFKSEFNHEPDLMEKYWRT